ncbi:hypothetical protein [Candidatus Uabimicrobium amorphum]|uniref:Uncharacterized protein n=1 Tax=Uabimicrobium amorphum TaxID=2596890 RepID=A0A5S9INR9_UABAM|nr:hypothetical protein [Candidatus Uabimicrobium amorphum]BBM84440.1 hypothetical protein UABAM_02800 [Candidatus Uabimicrobium amorphum]
MHRTGTGFLDLSSALALSTTISTLGNVGISAFGTIKGLDLQEEQLKLQEEIAERQLDIQSKTTERELEILDLQIEGSRASQEIDLEVERAIADLQISQAKTLQLEEEIKRELVSLQFEKQTGKDTELVEDNVILQTVDTPESQSIDVVPAQEQVLAPIQRPTNRGNVSPMLFIGGGILAFLLFGGSKNKSRSQSQNR